MLLLFFYAFSFTVAINVSITSKNCEHPSLLVLLSFCLICQKFFCAYQR